MLRLSTNRKTKNSAEGSERKTDSRLVLKKLLTIFLCVAMFVSIVPGNVRGAMETKNSDVSGSEAPESYKEIEERIGHPNNELRSTTGTYSGNLSSVDPRFSEDILLNSTSTPELSIDSVTIDKERMRVGETLTISASGADDCYFLADVYLNNQKSERITGTGILSFVPEEKGIYSFALEIRDADQQSAFFFLDHAVVVSECWELLAVSVNAEEAATGSTIVFSAVMSQEAGTQNPEGSGSALQYSYAIYKDGDLYKEVFDSADDSLSMYLTEPGVYYCVCSVVDDYGTESTATSSTVTLATETQMNENYNTPTHSNTLPLEELGGSSASDLRVAPGAVTVSWTKQSGDSYYTLYVECRKTGLDIEEENYTGTAYTIPASDILSGYEYSVTLFRYDSSGTRLSRSNFHFSVTGVESLVFEDKPKVLVPKQSAGQDCYVKYDDLTVQWTKMNYVSAIEIRLEYSCGISMHEVLLTTVDGKADTYTIPKSALVNGAYHELRLKFYDALGNTETKNIQFNVGEGGTLDEFNIDATTLTSTFLSDGSDRSAIPTYPAYEPIRLDWLDVPSAAYFSVHLFDYDNDNQETTYDLINAPTFVIDPSTLVSGHRYQVRVYSHHTAECYKRSDDRWFRAPYVGSLRLNPPNLTSMELSTDSSDPTIMTLRPLSLVWEPESAAVSYLVSLYMDDEETPDFEQTGITETQVTIPQDDLWINELYELNIAAVDSAGNSAFSVFYLKFVRNNLTAPSLLTPSLSTDRNVFPICSLSNMPVTWSEVADTAGYRFQLFDYYMGDWDKILDAEQITDTTYTIPKNKLYMGGKFKFRIKAVDAYGNGKWSETYYFRVGGAGYISLSSSELAVSAEAGRKAFYVTSGEGWTATSSASWLSISEASAAGSQQVAVIYAENTGEFPRTASITFINSDGGTAVYTVTQEGQSSKNSGALRITSPKQGSILDYASFRATWKYNYYHAYYQVSLKDTVTGALVHTENNIITSYVDIPIGALVYGHAYRLTVGVYDAQGNRISEGSVVFAIDGFDTQTFVEAEDQPVIAGSSNPEGNTEICYSGITDGAAVEQDNILVTWENVIDADHYWVALRDLTLNPDSIPSEEVERIINMRVDLLKMCIIAGQLTPGHDYRLWIAANRNDGSLIDGKNICFSVMPADGVAFRDLLASAAGESIRWSGTVQSEKDTILTATVSITTPIMPDGSFDTGYFRATGVNAASFDYASIHSGAVTTGGVVNCTDESGNAKTLNLTLPGNYTVAFHVYTAGGIYKTEQRTVTIGSNDTKPVLSGFSHTATITQGGAVYLSGTITAADGGTLQRVTIKCSNAGGSENTVATVAVGAASLDLSTLSFRTAEFPEIFTGPGTYEFVLCAAADNFTMTDNSIITFTVEVKGLPKPLINPISASSGSITVGSPVSFSTVVSASTQLSSVSMYIDETLVKTIETSEDSIRIDYSTDDLDIGNHIVKVVAFDAAGQSNVTTNTFEILPVLPGTIFSFSISSKEFDAGSNISLIVETTTDVVGLRLLDGAFVFRELFEGYTDQDGKRIWEFEQYIGSAGVDRTIKVESYTDGWTGIWRSVTFTARAGITLGSISINSPERGTPGENLTFSWTAPEVAPDRYVVHVGYLDDSCITVRGTSATVWGDALLEGVYPVTVTAQKAGFSDVSAYSQVIVACQHTDKTRIEDRYGSWEYQDTSTHRFSITAAYRCNTCGAVFEDKSTTSFTSESHANCVALENGVWLCECGYIHLVPSEIAENCQLRNKSKAPVYKSVNSNGNPSAVYGEVWSSDVFRVLGTIGEYSLIEYPVSAYGSHVNGVHNKKAGFIKSSDIGTIQESSPGTGATLPSVNESDYRIYCPSAFKYEGKQTLYIPKDGSREIYLIDINNGGKQYRLDEVTDKTIEWDFSVDKPFYTLNAQSSKISYKDNSILRDTDVSDLTLIVNGIPVHSITVYSGQKTPEITLKGKWQGVEDYGFSISLKNTSDVVECGIIYNTCGKSNCDGNARRCGYSNGERQLVISSKDTIKSSYEESLSGTHGYIIAYMITPYGIYYSDCYHWQSLSYAITRQEYYAQGGVIDYSLYMRLGRPMALSCYQAADKLVAITRSDYSVGIKLILGYDTLKNVIPSLKSIAMTALDYKLMSYEGVYESKVILEQIVGTAKTAYGYADYDSKFWKHLVNKAIDACLEEAYKITISQLSEGLRTTVQADRMTAMLLSLGTSESVAASVASGTAGSDSGSVAVAPLIFEEHPCEYKSIGLFENGHAVADLGNGIFRIIDTGIKTVCEIVDLCSIALGSRFFAYSTEAAAYVCTFDGAEVYSLPDAYLCDGISNDEYLSLYSIENEKYAVLRTDGSVVLPFVYDVIALSGSMAITEKNDQWELIDLRSNESLFASPYELSFLGPGTIKIYNHDMYGMIDDQGNTLFDFGYSGISYRNSCYVLSEVVDEFGDTVCTLLDHSLNTLFSFNGSFVSCSDGIVVYIDSASGDYCICSLSGEIISKRNRQGIRSLGEFSGGIAIEEDNYGLFRYIDPFGNRLSEETYDYASSFSDGYALVYRSAEADSNGVYEGYFSIIDSNFNEVKKISASVCCNSDDGQGITLDNGCLPVADKQTGLMGYMTLYTDDRGNHTESYSFSLLSCTEKSATVSLNFSNWRSESVQVLLAAFNAAGKMIGCTSCVIAEPSRIPLTLLWNDNEESFTVKGFVLYNDSLIPVGPAWVEPVRIG